MFLQHFANYFELFIDLVRTVALLECRDIVIILFSLKEFNLHSTARMIVVFTYVHNSSCAQIFGPTWHVWIYFEPEWSQDGSFFVPECVQIWPERTRNRSSTLFRTETVRIRAYSVLFNKSDFESIQSINQSCRHSAVGKDLQISNSTQS